MGVSWEYGGRIPRKEQPDKACGTEGLPRGANCQPGSRGLCGNLGVKNIGEYIYNIYIYIRILYTQMLNVWSIYLHLGNCGGKCR